MELELVRELVPLPDETIRSKVVNSFNVEHYDRNFTSLKLWFEEVTQTFCNANYENQIHLVLKGSKNDLSRARKRLKYFLINKENGKFPEWYQFYDLQNKYDQFKNFFCLCQPGTTPEGHRVSILGFTSSSMEHFDVDVLFQTLFMIEHLGLCLGNHYFIGCICIIDCKHVTTKHALKILSWTFRRYAKFQNEVLPYRIVKLYMINVPKYIEKFVTIGKALISDKIRKRFVVEQSDKAMRQLVPKEFLPSDYGGLGESVEAQIQHWFNLINKLRPWYEAEDKVRWRAPNASQTNTINLDEGMMKTSLQLPSEKSTRTTRSLPYYEVNAIAANGKCDDEDEEEDEDETQPFINNSNHNINKNMTKCFSRNDNFGLNYMNDDYYDNTDTTVLKFSFGKLEID